MDATRQRTGNRGKLVIADASTKPGIPVAAWPPAAPGQDFTTPNGRGTQRLVSTDTVGICPQCHRAVSRLRDGTTVSHKVGANHCPGSGEQPADGPPLATWLPIKPGLTPHGYRHSQKTWMIEDGIPEILAEQRLGHQVPGMRGWYAHVSQQMRDELLVALHVRWGESLRQRAAIDPHSPLPLLDGLLAPYRDNAAPATVHPIHNRRATADTGEMISQISPNTRKAPIHGVG
jgi:hypothetical protein